MSTTEVIPFTFETCRTICEQATFSTNYSFMYLVVFALLSLSFSKLLETINFKEANKDKVETGISFLNELGILFLYLSCIYFLYLKYTGGLL